MTCTARNEKHQQSSVAAWRRWRQARRQRSSSSCNHGSSGIDDNIGVSMAGMISNVARKQ